jgi:hypothetical protein
VPELPRRRRRVVGCGPQDLHGSGSPTTCRRDRHPFSAVPGVRRTTFFLGPRAPASTPGSVRMGRIQGVPGTPRSDDPRMPAGWMGECTTKQAGLGHLVSSLVWAVAATPCCEDLSKLTTASWISKHPISFAGQQVHKKKNSLQDMNSRKCYTCFTSPYMTM